MMTNEDSRCLRLPDGRMMGYAEYGTRGGMPLLAIHGTPGSRKMLQPADKIARAKNIWLIAPDRPGYGLSSPNANGDFSPFIDDIERLLDHLHIERFMLFGVSGGGPFATAIATSLPDRVSAFALVSPVGLFDDEVRKNWSARNALFFKLLPRFPQVMKLVFPLLRLMLLHAPNLPLKLFIRSLGPADRAVLSQPAHMEELLVAFNEGFRTGVLGALADLQLFSRPWQLPFEKAGMPIIMWQGMEDHMVPPQGTLQLARALPEVELIILEKQGHFWIFDHIEEVLEKLATSAEN